MKILLILPAGDRVRVTQETLRVPRRGMLRFSVLPLTTVAALTPPHHEVSIVDENVEALDLNADCDLVGITFMTALAPRAYEIAHAFRARGKLVVGGGYHPTLCPGEAEQHLDAVVIGDAEYSWTALLEDIEHGRLQKRYGGGAARHGAGAQSFTTPPARRRLLAKTARHYVTINAVQTSRGCPHACRYCSITAFHARTQRQRPVPEVLDELRGIEGGFIFVDDNIAADRAYATELFAAMVPLRRTWVSQCSIEIADDPELLARMHAAGCRGLFIGIETTNAANLAAMGKTFNQTATYRERIARIRGAGIGIVAGIIVGLDQDDPRVFQDTLRFLEEARIDSVQVNILTPLPGTPLFEDLTRAGRVVDRDWSHYDFRHVVFRPAGMTAEELQAGADWLYVQFYRLDRILLRFARGLFTVGVVAAVLGLRLGLTYRYDNRREHIVGWNPADVTRTPPAAEPLPVGV